MAHSRMPPQVELFCTVVDNFGDIGVTWRLAHQLQHEHGYAVRIWIDDLTAFARLEPQIDPAAPIQALQSVEVRTWSAQGDAARALLDAPLGHIIIEMFACELPAALIHQLSKQASKPRWINLEYLSAEAWVEGSHGLTSIHPATGLAKTFFFPGFTARTGGLFRERNLLMRHQTFDVDAWRAARGLPLQASLVSLFCYPNAPVQALIDAWAAAGEGVTLLVPEGIAPQAVSQGPVTVRRLAFVTQPEYDELLWACDLNFVRGEDSFVRAQFAGKPFVWQAYEQGEGAHFTKLAAFMERAALPDPVKALWRAWNRQPDALPVGVTQDQARAAMPEWRAHALAWRDSLFSQDDLATKLVKVFQQR